MVKANKQTHVKVLAMAISVAMMPWVSTTAFAAGLGRLTVYSAMGQPLRAQLVGFDARRRLTAAKRHGLPQSGASADRAVQPGWQHMEG